MDRYRFVITHKKALTFDCVKALVSLFTISPVNRLVSYCFTGVISNGTPGTVGMRIISPLSTLINTVISD